MLAKSETLDWIRSYYELLDTGRFDETARFFTDDATLEISGYPAMTGPQGIVASTKAGMSLVRSIRHDVLHAWVEQDGTLVFMVEANYDMPDDRKIVVPGVVVARVDDGRFAEQRIYADLSVVYGQGG